MFLDGQNHPEFNATGGDPNSSIFAQIVEFAKNLPLFSDLNLNSQVSLLYLVYVPTWLFLGYTYE